MGNRTMYITVRIDLDVPDNYALLDSEIADDFAQVNVRLSEDSRCKIDNVQICGVNDI